ncbi:hypothetical protein ACFQX7_16065 [Luedemannella flava]
MSQQVRAGRRPVALIGLVVAALLTFGVAACDKGDGGVGNALTRPARPRTS